MTKVKICGITRAEDAELAVALGADYLGFVFVPESPRSVTPEQARQVIESTSRRAGAVSTTRRHDDSTTRFVGVFRNASRDEILPTIEVANLDIIQVHGSWDSRQPPTANRQPVPVIQAFSVQNELPDTDTAADYILFDTGGGTGRTFDWSLLAAYPRTKPFFLAGGITPDNVAEAIARTQPFAIDLASGVESAPGIKDHQKMKRLFEAISR